MTSFFDRIAPFWQPHAGQHEFLSNTSKIRVLACGRRWGKTDACAVGILASLFRESPARHVLIAPTLDQAKILFDRTLELLDKLIELEGMEETPQIRRTPYPKFEYRGHRVAARSGHLGRSLRGNEATDIVIDEAAFIPEELLTEVAMPMLATTNGSLTLISTPRGMNHFYRFFQMGVNEEHGVWSRRLPSSESPFITPGYLEIQREIISDRAFRVEYEAEFLDSAGRVFSTVAIDSCLVAGFDEGPSPPFSIGVDWARYSDYTAVAVVSGIKKKARLIGIERFHGMSWKDQVARVAQIIRQFDHPMVTCDATAGGDVLYELLKEQLPGVGMKEFVFSSASKPGLIDRLVTMFDNGYLKMQPHPELLRELQHFEAK